MDPSEINTYRRAMLMRTATILADPFLSPAEKTAWEQYRNALQDLNETAANLQIPQTPAEPAYPISSDQAAIRAELAANRETIRNAYQTMIVRLEQIQNASNPTNAEVIKAVKDEALYIERIMKVLKNMLT